MRAAREQGNQNGQARRREQPLVRLNPGRFGSAHNEAQTMSFREIVQMVATNSRKF